MKRGPSTTKSSYNLSNNSSPSPLFSVLLLLSTLHPQHVFVACVRSVLVDYLENREQREAGLGQGAHRQPQNAFQPMTSSTASNPWNKAATTNLQNVPYSTLHYILQPTTFDLTLELFFVRVLLRLSRVSSDKRRARRTVAVRFCCSCFDCDKCVVTPAS